LVSDVIEHQVTRKGQVTIPLELREKFDLSEGSRVAFEDAGDCIVIRKATGFLDLIGSGAGRSTPKEMNRLLGEMRKQDA
jgi:AbrB family looped-hinge helix DNA binding protein